jgi:hypothetical protein
MGMKTHTYLYHFLENMKIKLTYHNTLKKSNEVEHDHISAWLEQDTLVITMIESKTREIKPWLPVDDQAGKAARMHSINSKRISQHSKRYFQISQKS